MRDRTISPSGGTAPPHTHTLFEDAQAIVTGALVVAFGIMLVKDAGLLTGGTAGLAFLIHYATGWNFGIVGAVQMALDCAIVVAALAIVEPRLIGISILGAIALNLVVAVYHSPGRYLGF
jgi:uncharacterized membrane-anchored protein YitT (DUF2179 family)